jgi:hypothetical protein
MRKTKKVRYDEEFSTRLLTGTRKRLQAVADAKKIDSIYALVRGYIKECLEREESLI